MTWWSSVVPAPIRGGRFCLAGVMPQSSDDSKTTQRPAASGKSWYPQEDVSGWPLWSETSSHFSIPENLLLLLLLMFNGGWQTACGVHCRHLLKWSVDRNGFYLSKFILWWLHYPPGFNILFYQPCILQKGKNCPHTPHDQNSMTCCTLPWCRIWSGQFT